MAWISPISRKLYLRIWLAVAASVLALSLLIGMAWKEAERNLEQERDRLGQREVLVLDAHGKPCGNALAQMRLDAERNLQLQVQLVIPDGQSFNLFIPVRERRHSGGGGRHGSGSAQREWASMAWLRPPYGFVWMLALAGVAVMAALFPVARRLTRRLVALQSDVQHWGEGNLALRVNASGNDEIADLARHFNTAAERIQSLLEKQAALLRAQKSLLANASHELRSPLARIRMALELMGLREGAPAQSTRDEIARNVAELDELVGDLLLASRLEAQQADLGGEEEVDLVALLAEECGRAGANFEPATGTRAVLVQGVPRLLRTAVRNLLENARRYGNQGVGSAEPTWVALERAGREALIRVGDRGPGVPEAQRERIFEPFYRLPGASEREGGVGLGLALVRQIVQRHAGQVFCRDRADGGGAEFVIALPLADDAAGSAAPPPPRNLSVPAADA
ncbi:MAG: HAMP domain-containing histidine kinase [Burkholderiaceae bacterium]|jgi:signal transduction histidine kinase|nr:HAMP domain-containing histidine kinase [Burkholderiaceae bacterium]